MHGFVEQHQIEFSFPEIPSRNSRSLIKNEALFSFKAPICLRRLTGFFRVPDSAVENPDKQLSTTEQRLALFLPHEQSAANCFTPPSFRILPADKRAKRRIGQLEHG